MIEKTLDKYFAKKCIKEIKEKLIIYNLDVKFIKQKNCYHILIKKKKYKDYTLLNKICFKDATAIFILLNDYWKEIIEPTLKQYLGDKE